MLNVILYLILGVSAYKAAACLVFVIWALFDSAKWNREMKAARVREAMSPAIKNPAIWLGVAGILFWGGISAGLWIYLGQ